MKPTLRSIAKDLDLSPASVSKALSGSKEISIKTRKKVTDYAQAAGYFKNQAARSRFGVLAANPSDMEDSYHSLMFNFMMGFQRYAGYLQNDVIIININSEEQEKENLDCFVYNNQLSGLFITGIKNTDPYYTQLQTVKTPVVVMDIPSANPLVGSIGTDSIFGGELAISHLIQLGHKKIGFVNGHRKAYISQERMAGYFAALYAYQMPLDPALCFEGDFSIESGAKAADYFANTDVTAIYFASDIMAIGAMHRFQKLGFNLPADMSIIGFDNQTACLNCNPTLTTVAQDPIALGEAACALLHILSQKKPIRNVKLEPILVIRESTGPVRILNTGF